MHSQGYNDNGHGTHKIDYALQYGIMIPLQKYIEELEMIQEGEEDDKSEKRNERLTFLRSISDIDVLVNYFQNFTTYLNGGSNFPECRLYGSNFEYNKIIITAAGGNIVTIFTKLLHDLLVNGEDSEIPFNIQRLTAWSLSEQLKFWIANCPRRTNVYRTYGIIRF